jgi:hypothetical protein
MRAFPLGAALGAALALSGMLPLEARAQNKSRPGAVAAVPLPADAIKRLKSGDPAQVQGALDDVRLCGTGGAPAAKTIVDVLDRGLPPELTLSAIATLGDTQSPAANEALAWYARHRDIGFRRAAITALGKLHGPVPARALRNALSDPDEGVRGLAATEIGGLEGNTQLKETVADLFLALDHKVEEAAASIGQLCDATDCKKLAGKLGVVPFDVMAGALDQVLLRPPKDIDEATKVDIVDRVRELGTADVHQFLQDLQSKWPPKGSPRVKATIDQAVTATTGSPGHRAPAEAPQ